MPWKIKESGMLICHRCKGFDYIDDSVLQKTDYDGCMNINFTMSKNPA